MDWTTNALIFWSLDGITWSKVSDHNREPLNVSYERIEVSGRTVAGTLRKQVVAKKRIFSTSWTNLPSVNDSVLGDRVGMSTADGGMSGSEMETFYKNNDGPFYMKLRKGLDISKDDDDVSIETVMVMFSDYSRDVGFRGPSDFWNVSLTMEEV